MAEVQTRAEMEAAWSSEQPSTSGSPDQDSGERGTVSEEMLALFWEEHGLRATAAARLAQELVRSGQAFSLEWLSSRMSRWGRLLPGVDVAALVQQDSDLLGADLNLALRNVVILIECIPNVDVMSMVARKPQLLRSEDLRERLQASVEWLVRLHPSGDPDVVMGIIVENPQLLWRWHYYQHVTLIDELPLEIQNMFIIADQGLGALHRYWRNHRTNYRAEMDSSSRG